MTSLTFWPDSTWRSTRMVCSSEYRLLRPLVLQFFGRRTHILRATRFGTHVNFLLGPVVVYVHPLEIDPDQPRLAVRRSTVLRHYRNLHKTESHLSWLLDNFEFGTVRSVLNLGA